MIITDKKIEVTQQMMNDANMTRGSQLGIPVDSKNLSKGLRWKNMSGEMEDSDFDKIEEYFVNKQKSYGTTKD